MNNLGYIWFDGKIIEAKDAKVHLLTHALHYGSSVFEGIRIYNSNIFKLEEHIKRLLVSANFLAMDVTFNKHQIMDACKELLAKNKLSSGYIRPIIWRGDEDLKVGAKNMVHVAIAMWETPESSNKLNSFSLNISNWRKAPPEVFPPQCKGAGGYSINTVAKIFAKEQGYDDALLLDLKGYVAEATTSNIFAVINKKIFTPKTSSILNGITRQIVIGILKSLEYVFEEKDIKLEELLNADEIFLTGTAIEIASVKSVEGKQFLQNDIAKKVAKKYFSIINKNTT